MINVSATLNGEHRNKRVKVDATRMDGRGDPYVNVNITAGDLYLTLHMSEEQYTAFREAVALPALDALRTWDVVTLGYVAPAAETEADHE